jgi:putative phosphoesterase
MKEILLLSDVHANYPALKAVSKSLDLNRFDKIINAGDITVYSTFPNESIQWFKDLGERGINIVGNTDRRILRLLKGKKMKKPRIQEKRIMYEWTCEHLTGESIDFLRSLRKKNKFRVGGLDLGIFHGSAEKPNAQVFPSTRLKRFVQLAGKGSYDIHIMGHSHIPFHKIINGVHFINPGSIGRMFDGDPRASYAILRIDSAQCSVEHFRVPYEVADVVRGLAQHQLPGIYGEMFRVGRKLN